MGTSGTSRAIVENAVGALALAASGVPGTLASAASDSTGERTTTATRGTAQRAPLPAPMLPYRATARTPVPLRRVAVSRAIQAAAAPTQTPTRAPVETPTETPAQSPDRESGEDVRRRLLPPYKVILHNDDHNSMDHVVKAIQKSVPGINLGQAVAIMWAAHTNGKALVIACPLELAELYQQRLLSFGLTATIEKE